MRAQRFEAAAPASPRPYVTALLLNGLLVVGLGCQPARNAALGDADPATTGAPNTTDSQGAGENDPGLLSRLFGSESRTVVVQPGTVVQVALGDTLSSRDSQPGQTFAARVVQDVAVDGTVVIPAGTPLRGQVTAAEPARKIGGRAHLSLRFESVELDGRSAPIDGSIVRVGKSERAKDAAIIGGSTIAGAVLGNAIDDGDGGLVGAIVGGLAGTAGAKKTHGKPLVLQAGEQLALRLESPLEVSVAG